MVGRRFAQEWAERFSQKYELRLSLEDDALEAIVDRALTTHQQVRDICQGLFKDYEFGLKLIEKNSGQTEFRLPRVAVENPEKHLSDMVLASYRGSQQKPGESPQSS